MSDNEITFLKDFFEKAKNYFEYGSGGSTYLADSFPNINTIYSIESDQAWIEKVKENLTDSKTTFFYIDVDAGHWGAPKTGLKKENWPLYSTAMSRAKEHFDLILIDGRFRVACAAHIYPYMNTTDILLIHDYNRQEYYIIEELYTLVKKVDTLACFKKKVNMDNRAIELYEIYKFNCR